MSNRHLGALIVVLFVLMGAAVSVGFVAQSHNQAARRHVAIREQQERTLAVCKAENETREQVRLLARDLTHNPTTLAAVDRRFASKNCKAIATRH